ncbi:hypothetical protein CR512_07960 [Pseudomonas putida]|nr:hypothetical protein CR512_07960 [Pseudomonas putida]
MGWVIGLLPYTNQLVCIEPCGSGFTRECDRSGSGDYRSDAFAGKPAPTGVVVSRLSVFCA